MSAEKPQFIKERFPKLAGSPEVKKAAERRKARTGEQLPRDPNVLIQNYLNRFKEVVERSDPNEKKRGINALKKVLIDKFVVRVEDIPESYWQARLRVVRSRGEAGDWQKLSPEKRFKIKQNHLVQIKEDQKGSLEEWIDYMTSSRSTYLPDYLKYWAFQGMLRLERYEKGDEEKDIPDRFPERPSGKKRSIKMFPEVNDRALKFIAQAYEAASEQDIHFPYDITSEARPKFLAHLKRKNFRALYGWGQKHMPPISEKEMQVTDGRWVQYQKGSDPRRLTATLQGKGSGWCIAGENIAKDYLANGNLNVYYTRDRDEDYTIPRVVIVQKENRVTEVRGIEWEENVDGYMKTTNIISTKLQELPGGDSFEPTYADTKTLTAIDQKMSAGQPVTKEELIFLYELERPIKYFGYKQDPRIKELRKARNTEEDMLVIFDCAKEQIARSPREINENTKAYLGKLEPGIFDTIQKYNIEHIYTSFPEGKIRKEAITIGGKTWQQLKEEMESKNMQISPDALHMMKSSDFKILEIAEAGDYVRLRVRDLLPGTPTTDQIYAKAQELGLELCPAEVGPHYRLQNPNQPLYEYTSIAMKQIAAHGGSLSVFGVRHGGDDLSLEGPWTLPDDTWDPDFELLFRLRKKNLKS